MGAQNIISLGFNVEELTAEKKLVLDLFVDMFGTLQKYDGTKFNPLGNGGLADLKKSLQDGAAAMSEFQQKASSYNEVITEQFKKQQAGKKSVDDLTLAEKEHQKTLATIVQLQAKVSEADTNAANDKAIEAQKLKAITAEVNANAKAYTTAIGSIDEARATVAQLTLERNKENAATDEGKARIVELNAAIDKNNQFIKENVSTLEKQKINIGNYTGAISILKDSLNNIDGQLAKMAAAGDTSSEAFQRLTLEQKLMQQQFEKQQEGFGTVNAELRSLKSSLDAMTLSGLENGESFQRLNTVYETAKQKVNELHESQKILTSESPAITALTTAARGLGGAYALGAGASALFADGNEKVERELNKLVAIMTLLQGLEEAVRAIKERGAIATTLQATATKVLNAARQIEVALFGETIPAIASETEAKILNTEVTEANTGALEANAAGAALTGEAMEGLAAGEATAGAAAVGLRTALIATGIGALIIGVIYAITQLVGAVGDWINADDKAIEKQKALAESSKELLEINIKLNDFFEEGAKQRVDDLQKIDDKTKAAGQNQFVQLANERTILQQRQQNAKEELAFLDLEGAALTNLSDDRIAAGLKVESLESRLRDARRQDDGSVKDLTKQRDEAKAELDVIDAKYQKGYAAQKEYNDNTAKLDENAITQAKAAADLLAKITADAADRRYAAAQDANNRVLNLETSSPESRFNAIKRNYQAEVNLEQSKEVAIEKLLKAGIIVQSDADNQIANLRAERLIKYKKSLDDQLKLTIEYNDRELNARNGISKNQNEADAAIQDAITKDTQKELDARLSALQKSIADKTSVIVNDYNLQLKLAKEHGKTQTEIDQLDSDQQKALAALTASTQKDIYDIVVSYGEKKLKAIEEQNKAIDSASRVTQNYNADTSALDESLIHQTISYNKYVNEKRKLDQKYILDKDAADVADDELRLKQIQDFEQKKLAIELIFAEKDLGNAKAGGNDKEIADAQAKYDALLDIQTKAAGQDKAINEKLQNDKLKQTTDKASLTLKAEADLKDKEKQLEEATFNLGKQLVDQAFEEKVNAIQAEIDKVNEQADAEVAAVQRSTLSARDQAAEMIIIQATQKARDTELKKQEAQEKTKQAKFDRDLAVAKTVWDTEQAIMAIWSAYGDVPFLAASLTAAVVALGAVSVATILAKPIPTYSEGIGIPGKGEHPGGLAWTGEAYKPERVSIPGKKPFTVSTPTLLDLPARTSVLPLDSENMVFELGGLGMQRGMALMSTVNERNTAVEDAIKMQTYQLKRAYEKNQRQIINKINVHMDYGGLDPVYVMTKITGKRL